VEKLQNMGVKRLIANKLCDCSLFQQSTLSILLIASLSKNLISGPNRLWFTFTVNAIRRNRITSVSVYI